MVLLLVFSIVFSGLAGCRTTASNAANQGSANAPENVNSPTSGVKTTVYPPLASGLADAEFELLDGSKFKISERKGKILLLNIWGIWCGPCRAEMPHLVEMQAKYGERGFEVIGLNIGDENGATEDVEAIKKFAEKMKLNYTLARSPGASTAQFYRVTKKQVVPQSLLVDREGHLRGVFVGGGERVINSMKETLEKMINE